MGGIGKIFGGGSSSVPSGAAAGQAQSIRQAAQITADAQKEALNYLKEVESLPQELREGSLRQLGGAFGVPGGTGSQQEIIERSIASPLYQKLMGGQKAGEESILRNVSATGGLRSGNVQEALYDYNVNLENQALLQSYNQQMQGLQGLAGLPSMAPMIAETTAGIGQTLGQGEMMAGQTIAQGQIAQEQLKRQSAQRGMGNMMGMAQLGLAGYSAFSDRRLKKNIKKIAEIKGFNIYSWDWNSLANKMMMLGKSVGAMADEVFRVDPDAVTLRQNFMYVDYSKIGILEKNTLRA